MGGALPSFLRTTRTTGALVASCSSVCTSVAVGACCALPAFTAVPENCTRSWAVAAYSFGDDSEMARLTASPSSASAATHNFRRRRIMT